MKKTALSIAMLVCTAIVANAAFQIAWNTGRHGDKMMLDGVVSTTATFNSRYDCRLMYIGENTGYTPTRGFPTFIYIQSGVNISNEPGNLANLQYTNGIPDQYANVGEFFLLTIYEKATGKYFLLSDTPGGTTQYAYEVQPGDYDPYGPPSPFYPTYEPDSPTGYFHIGAQIPAFCTWLSSFNLVEEDIAGISSDLVNAAFAVNANPTNFSGVALSATGLELEADGHVSGSFALTALNAAQTPAPVTKLGDGAAITLLSSSTPYAITNLVEGAAANIQQGTFTITNAPPAPDTRFFRLRLTVPQLWP